MLSETARLRGSLQAVLEALNNTAKGRHDPKPTRLLPRSDTEIAIDTWWQHYYTSNYEQHKRIAKETYS